MHINQLNYFISVAQTLNFTESARHFSMSQPSVSHHIAELERELGAKLFTRTKRSVALTEAGKQFLPYATEMVRLSAKAQFQIEQLGSGISGCVTIAALSTSAESLSACLKEFSCRHPNIIVDIDFTSGSSQLLAMSDTKYDVHFTIEEMVPDNFDRVTTKTDYLCVAFPKGHPMSKKPLDFTALTNERFIAVSSTGSPDLYKDVMSLCAARNYKPQVTCRFDRPEAILVAVGAGLGISIIPEAISQSFYSKNVTFTHIDGSDSDRVYVASWPKKIVNPAASLFIDVIRDLYK